MFRSLLKAEDRTGLALTSQMALALYPIMIMIVDFIHSTSELKQPTIAYAKAAEARKVIF